MKRTTLSILLLYLTGIIYAQSIQISGCVIDNEKNILQAATIRCFTNDSIFVKGTTTNNQGHFNIDLPETKQKYQIKINYMGYKELIVNLNPTTEKRAQLGDIELKKDAVQIKEVVVLGEQMVRTEEKVMIYPTKQQLRHAYDGYSALTTLMIPGLDTDPFSKSASYNGQSVLLLINGREATKDEINNLNAKDIIRVDFYEQGHIEYPLAGSVLNYILKNRDHGGTMAFNGQQHLNKATGDYRSTVQFYKKKSEIAVSIADGYNHYRCHSNSEDKTMFDFPDGTLTETRKVLPSLAESNDLRSYVNYIYKGEKQNFYASLRFRNSSADNDDNSLQFYSNRPQELIMQDKSHFKALNPSLQLRYDSKMPNNRQLRIALYGSYGHNKYNRHYHSDMEKEIVSDYHNRTKENSWYVNPQITYTKTFKNKSSVSFNLNEGYTDTHNTYNSLDGITDAYYKESKTQLFATYNYRIPRKLNLKLRMGGILTYLDTKKSNLTRFTAHPGLDISYILNPKHILLFDFGLGTFSPVISSWTTAEQRIDDYQVRKGNPELDVMDSYGGNLAYIWQCSNRFSIKGGVYFHAITNKHYHDVYLDEVRSLYVHSTQNGGTFLENSYAIIGQYQIIPKTLTMELAGGYTWQKVRLWESLNWDYWKGKAKLIFMHKGWMLTADVTSKKHQKENGYKIESPIMYNMYASYSIDNWNIGLGARNPFTTSVSKVSYKKDGYNYYSRSSAPRINDDVFYVNINYRFNFGKKHKFDNTEVQDINQTTILKAKD